MQKAKELSDVVYFSDNESTKIDFYADVWIFYAFNLKFTSLCSHYREKCFGN